jgi:hypothetical protein
MLVHDPIDEMCAIATASSVGHEAIERPACATADPLPNGLDDLRLFAAVIVRQVRANRGTANASVHVTHALSPSTRSRHAGQATRSRSCRQADRRHPITEGGSSVPIHILFVELAGRRVHSVATGGRPG